MAREDPWCWRGVGGGKVGGQHHRPGIRVRSGRFNICKSVWTHRYPREIVLVGDADPQWDYWFEMRNETED